MNASGSKAALGLPMIDFVSENNWRDLKQWAVMDFLLPVGLRNAPSLRPQNTLELSEALISGQLSSCPHSWAAGISRQLRVLWAEWNHAYFSAFMWKSTFDPW